MIIFSNNTIADSTVNYLTNIENLTELIEDKYGIETVRAIYARYGATCIDNLPPSRLSEVFADLYFLCTES